MVNTVDLVKKERKEVINSCIKSIEDKEEISFGNDARAVLDLISLRELAKYFYLKGNSDGRHDLINDDFMNILKK